MSKQKKKAFEPNAFIIVFGIMIFCAILTWIIPAGSFDRVIDTVTDKEIVVAGSSSVSPVMEKLKEAYLAVNTNADIEIQTSDSTTGVTSTQHRMCMFCPRAMRSMRSSDGCSVWWATRTIWSFPCSLCSLPSAAPPLVCSRRPTH